MSSSVNVISNLGILIPAVESRTANYDEVYQQHCHRIYSLSFWMTDNELTAEQLSQNVFLRAFAASASPRPEQIDQALVAEIREFTTIGTLTLSATITPEAKSVHGNVKRVHLERAIVQLPATEKLIFLLHDVEGYNHARIAKLIGLSENESRNGLHQARLRMRELLAAMK